MAGMHDTPNGYTGYINGNLGSYVEPNSTTKRAKNNSTVREAKTYDGNIDLFCKSELQYRKRFPKRECCGAFLATERDLIERPESLIATSEGLFVDNMIEWGTVYICSQCGHIA